MRKSDVIKDAYDFKAAKRKCREQGFQSRVAYAHMKNGNVHLTLSKAAPTSRDDRHSAHDLYLQWLQASLLPGLFSTFAVKLQMSDSPRVVRCLAYSDGCGWRTWDEIEVCRILCNPGMRDGKGWSFISTKETIFDPDLSDNAWNVESKMSVADRSMAFAQSVLLDVAELHVQARELVGGFTQAVEKLDMGGEWNKATILAKALHEAKRAALRMMEAATALALGKEGPRAEQDEAIASRQGFLMGRWLAQAEAIIAGERAAKLAAVLGEGKKQSQFWEWVNTSPSFAGKTAKETWPLLDALKDPDHPSTKLKIEAGELKRGNGMKLTEASFRAKFRRH